MQNSTKTNANKKILILGLDNSGKTSILLSLKRNSNLLSYLALNPTRGLHIEQFNEPDFKAGIWDFGGQKEFRSQYLQELENYLEGTTEVIFVIDIQDIDRYDLALEYLGDLIKIIHQEQQSNLKFSIFLHKYDPNLINQKEFKEIEDKVDSKLIKKIVALIPANYHYKLFKTSVYSVFNKNLIISK